MAVEDGGGSDFIATQLVCDLFEAEFLFLLAVEKEGGGLGEVWVFGGLELAVLGFQLTI